MRCCALCLVSGLLSVALAVPSSTFAQSATPSAAHIYVQTKSGVDVFNANAAGQLTMVSGSPFPDTGEMEAVRGNALISVGTTWLHSYAIEANGAVGPQLAEVNTANYEGSECGTTDNSGSILDHTGEYFSVQLYGALTDDGNNYLCDAWQTYKVASNGEFTFVGAWVGTQSSDDSKYEYENSPLEVNLRTVSSNNKYVYGWVGDPDGIYFVPFTRAASGEIMLNEDFTETDPTPQPGSQPYPNPDSPDYFPQGVAADPSGHLGALLVGNGTPYIASYTINPSNGSITSTNSWKNMPTTNHNYPLAMSPAGNLLALASTDQYPDGVAIFHFNGAAPATYFTTFLPKVQIDLMAWDKSNHLYMLSYETDEIYVYTVTPTSVTPVAGSPYSVPGAAKGAWEETGFVVVPQ